MDVTNNEETEASCSGTNENMNNEDSLTNRDSSSESDNEFFDALDTDEDFPLPLDLLSPGERNLIDFIKEHMAKKQKNKQKREEENRKKDEESNEKSVCENTPAAQAEGSGIQRRPRKRKVMEEASDSEDSSDAPVERSNKKRKKRKKTTAGNERVEEHKTDSTRTTVGNLEVSFFKCSRTSIINTSINFNSIIMVLDTNILIDHIDLLEKIDRVQLPGLQKPVIYISWHVLVELDLLKMKQTTRWKAKDAVRFLCAKFGKDRRYQAQDPDKAIMWRKEFVKCVDDEILCSCLGLQREKQSSKVIFATEDGVCYLKAYAAKISALKMPNFQEADHKLERSITDEAYPPESIEMRENVRVTAYQSRKVVHQIMEKYRLELKETLIHFFSGEEKDAPWGAIDFKEKGLKEIFSDLNDMWEEILSKSFSSSFKVSMDILNEKINRIEGFIGDKSECLMIAYAIEDLFLEMSTIDVSAIPTDRVKHYRCCLMKAFVGCPDATRFFEFGDE